MRPSGSCYVSAAERQSYPPISTHLVLTPTIYRQSRTPPLLPLSLSISSFPPLPPTPTPTTPSVILEPTIFHVLSTLLPTTIHIPLSIALLNESKFVPKSRDENLHSGALQLSPGTTVVVSDGAVSEGVLQNGGFP